MILSRADKKGRAANFILHFSYTCNLFVGIIWHIKNSYAMLDNEILLCYNDIRSIKSITQKLCRSDRMADVLLFCSVLFLWSGRGIYGSFKGQCE